MACYSQTIKGEKKICNQEYSMQKEEGEIENFKEKQMLKEFMTTNSALQETLEGAL